MSYIFMSCIFMSSNFMPAISSVCFTSSIFSHPEQRREMLQLVVHDCQQMPVIMHLLDCGHTASPGPV